jgi:hypothetical protein
MPTPSLYLASPCYGGVAQARFMRSLIALRAACAQRGVPLQLDLGGGEALASRGRAAMMATFLGTEASHLVFADSEQAFDPEPLLDRLAEGDPPNVARLENNFLLINRPAAQALTDAHPSLAAGLADLAGAGARRAAMVFDALIDPANGRYLTDLEAFWWRWERLGAGLAADLTAGKRSDASLW